MSGKSGCREWSWICVVPAAVTAGPSNMLLFVSFLYTTAQLQFEDQQSSWDARAAGTKHQICLANVRRREPCNSQSMFL